MVQFLPFVRLSTVSKLFKAYFLYEFGWEARSKNWFRMETLADFIYLEFWQSFDHTLPVLSLLRMFLIGHRRPLFAYF